MTQAEVDPRNRQHDGWIVHEQGPQDATRGVLLLLAAVSSLRA